MRAWALILTAAIFYTQCHGSSNFGEKMNPPVTTESPISSAESSKGPSKDTSLPDIMHADSVDKWEHSSGSLEIMKTTKPTKGVAKTVEKMAHYSTPAPQHPLRQHMESTYDVKSASNSGYDDNPLAALYEATREAYVQPNMYSNPALHHFQSPTTPYDNVHFTKPLLKSTPVAPFLSNQPIHSNPPPTTVNQQNTNNGFAAPHQHSAIQETSFYGINTTNDDYDDGSYDPYKYGDYLYFDNNDHDYYNQDFQKANTPLKEHQMPYQQSQSFHSNHNYQLANSNNHPPNYDYYNQNYQSGPPSNVLPAPHQQSQSQYFHSNQNYQPANNYNHQQNYDYYNQNYHNANTPSNALPTPIGQSQYLYSNPNNKLINNNYQQNPAEQTPQHVFQPQHVPRQKPSLVHKSKSNARYNLKDASNAINDNYSYQVEAAKQYLQEIEESQEYAKKILAASTSPAATHHTSQPLPVQDGYSHNQNQHISSTNTEGRYNNLESVHHKPTNRPRLQIHQAVEVNSLMPHLNEITYQEHEGNNVEDSEIFSGHQEPARNPSPYAVPVILPNGFLADTEEVRLAKVKHLQLVLDTLQTLSTYRNQYPKRKLNAL